MQRGGAGDQAHILCNRVDNIAMIGVTGLGEGGVVLSMSQEISGHMSAAAIKALRLPHAHKTLIAETCFGQRSVDDSVFWMDVTESFARQLV